MTTSEWFSHFPSIKGTLSHFHGNQIKLKFEFQCLRLKSLHYIYIMKIKQRKKTHTHTKTIGQNKTKPIKYFVLLQ